LPFLTFNYFFSSHIITIAYGPNPRSHLDIHLPRIDKRKPNQKMPVVIFLNGGGWIIGYKGWAGICSIPFLREGIIMIAPDHRNFPEGNVREMLSDVTLSIDWVFKNIESFGGDTKNITVMGQSAGAHLIFQTAIEKAEFEFGKKDGVHSIEIFKDVEWKLQDIKGLVGISGIYDLSVEVEHLHQRGLYKHVLFSIMEGELENYSPYRRINKKFFKENKNIFPPVKLVHGTKDFTMPHSSSEKFHNALLSIGVSSKLKLFDGKSHTDAILEDIILGNHLVLNEIIFAIQTGDFPNKNQFLKYHSIFRNYPSFLVKLARNVNPF